MMVLKTRYELRLGEPAEVPATAETVDFLVHARTRRVTIANRDVEGLVVAPNQSNDGIVIAASSKVKPGQYAVTLSATGAAGEVRETAVDVVVKPRATVPNGSTRAPVVLINGWITGFSNACPVATSSSITFGNLAQYLVSDGVPVVYLFDNCLEDPGQLVEGLGNDLAAYFKTITYDDGTQVPQIDVVAHSMGGLIARSYLSGLQSNGVYTPPSPPLIGKLVLIASPNFGSFVAGNYVTELVAGTQSIEMVPGSALLWNLATWNQRGDDLYGVNAISIVGNAGPYLASLEATTQLNNASDGLVSETSASLGFVSQQPTQTRVVPYCHVDPSAFTSTLFGPFNCNAVGIADVNSTSHLTGQIVRSFLAGATDWQSIGTAASSDPNLSTYGAAYFAMQNSSAGYATDISSVTYGTVLLTDGGNLGTIYYTDFVTGTGNYSVVSTSLGTINCGTLATAVGYFAATRCKLGAAIVSVTPLSTTARGRAVTAGTAITLNGSFGSACSNCKVYATPAGATTATALAVTSWTNSAIVAQLPASMTGYVTLSVNGVPGSDAIGVIAVSQSTLSVTPVSQQYAYTVGGALPDSQTIAISNTGSTGLAWTATVTSTGSWLSVSATSGTSPSTVTLSVAPALLTAGTYTGTVVIMASGISPITVTVTLVVTAAPASLVVSPLSLTYQYTVGGTAPAAQAVSISNASGASFNWTALSGVSWLTLSAASGTAPSALNVSVNPANLAAGTYNSNVIIGAADGSVTPVSVAVSLVVTGALPAPVITSASNGGSFQPGFAAATWVSIFGTDLSAVTYSWQASDFVNGALPTSLQGVSVTINGIPAFVSYISSKQINVLAPDDATTGMVPIQVTVAQQPSNAVMAQKNAFAPAFLTFDGTYVAALQLNYSLLGKPNLLTGLTTTPAVPGSTVILYGVGFGPTNPVVPTGQTVAAAEPLASNVQITIGGMAAPASFAGLSGSGLYQFNVTVPNLPPGDAALSASIGGVATQTGVIITIGQ